MNHYQEYFSDRSPPFGKYQRGIAIASFMWVQFILYSMSFLIIYSLVTLNFPLIIFLSCISILQNMVSRNQKYIDFVNDFVQVRRYLKGYDLIFEQPIEKNEKCLFGIHPHGVLSICCTVNMNLKNTPFADITGLSSRMMLLCPFVGLILRLWGVQSVDNNNMRRLMKLGKNIILIPGGFEEATITSPNELRIYIKNRKGFIKYAIQHNYEIYPTLYLNEHRAFWTFDYFTKFRLFLNKLKLPAVFFWNPKTLFFLPPDMQYYTIVGKKINYRALQPNQQITHEQIDAVHSDYIQELKRVYEKYRHLNGGLPMKIY